MSRPRRASFQEEVPRCRLGSIGYQRLVATCSQARRGTWESLKAAECSFARADSFHEAQGITSDIHQSHTMSHKEIWGSNTLAPQLLPNDHAQRPPTYTKAKWLRNGFERGMAAEEPGADEYAAEGLNPCSAIQVWPCRSDVK